MDKLAIGKTGEYLVCADLAQKGFICFLSEQGLPYDCVLDINGLMLKIQVKTTQGPHKNRPQEYQFNTSGVRQYTRREADIIALVVLDKNQIGYLPVESVKGTIRARVEGATQGTPPYLSELTLAQALPELVIVTRKNTRPAKYLNDADVMFDKDGIWNTTVYTMPTA